jgi:hypothetical protein
MTSIPERIDQVDAAWLRDVTGWAVDAVELDPIGAGVGFIGRLARLHLAGPDVVAGRAPATAIVKLPTDDPGGQLMGRMMRMWEREHLFYEQVAPHLQVRVPIAHVNLYDDPGGSGPPHAVLLLEDLHPLSPGDQVVGATGDQARVVVDRLAALHAQWWEHPLLDELDWMPSILDPMVEAVVPMFEAGWSGFCDRYRGSLPDRPFAWAERFVSLIPTWLAAYREDPRTIAHGDARLDNMFFGDAANPEFALVDWQMAMRSPGGGDLAYFVMTDLDVESRRANERELIDLYGDSIVRYGAPAEHVDTDVLWRGYLEGVLFYCVGMGSSLLTLDPANQRGLDLIDALVTRVFTAADDLDAGEHVLPRYE